MSRILSQRYRNVFDSEAFVNELEQVFMHLCDKKGEFTYKLA